MRRRAEQNQTAQPWYRRYRLYILIPLILGYAIIYGWRSAPLRLVDPINLPFEAVDNNADEDGADARNQP
jgi:hypothetical protein